MMDCDSKPIARVKGLVGIESGRQLLHQFTNPLSSIAWFIQKFAHEKVSRLVRMGEVQGLNSKINIVIWMNSHAQLMELVSNSVMNGLS